MHLEYHSKDNYKSKHISHETGLLLWIENNWSYDNHKAATLEESTKHGHYLIILDSSRSKESQSLSSLSRLKYPSY